MSPTAAANSSTIRADGWAANREQRPALSLTASVERAVVSIESIDERHQTEIEKLFEFSIALPLVSSN